jgi:hypothetical protein
MASREIYHNKMSVKEVSTIADNEEEARKNPRELIVKRLSSAKNYFQW